MIRLIVSDIDGTLVPEGGMELNPEYMDVIRKLTDKGIAFAAASGRQLVSIDGMFSSIRDRIYYLSDSGSIVQEYGKTAMCRSIEPEDLEGLLKDLRVMKGIQTVLSYEEGYYIEEYDENLYQMLFHQYRGKGGVVDSFSDRLEGCVKVSLYVHRDPEECVRILKERWGERLTINISGAEWVDITHKEATKGGAVTWMQNKLGVTPEETMVFGDNFNDISMFRCAGESYVSESSHPDVQKEAKYIVPTYEKNGVLTVLKQLL